MKVRAFCTLDFDVPDGAAEDGVKQGLLELMNSVDIWVEKCSFVFSKDEEYGEE